MSGKKRYFATRTLPQPIPLTFEDESGTRVTEPFTVKYRSFSPAVAREMRTVEGGEGASLARSLASIVVSITDEDGAAITDQNGEPASLTEECFDAWSAPDNLKALYDAITEDVNPVPTSPPS